MAVRDQKRNTLLFVGFLVLAGVIHIVANIVHNTAVPHYSLNTMLFCLEFVIYTMLIFFWLQAVRIRLLPTRAKTYMLILATQMVAYLSLRAFKYRIAESAVAISPVCCRFFTLNSFTPLMSSAKEYGRYACADTMMR